MKLANRTTPEDWTPEQDAQFVALYKCAVAHQRMFAHPEAAKVPAQHWDTLCWNFAWAAVIKHEDNEAKFVWEDASSGDELDREFDGALQ